jgi:hypothetical protein
MLHVTNGTSVSLDRTGLGGEILTWMDVLHEGPVPAGLGHAELTHLRGLYLDEVSPGPSSAADTLEARDRTLARFTEHEEVALWFEHDLYDQLQLIQILDWFHGRTSGRTRLSLICIDRYLGSLTGEQLATLWPDRHTITSAEFDLAAEAWRAFRSPDPMDLENLRRRDIGALPFLAGALLRHLQQFPSVENGLARTERQILELVDAGRTNFASLFRADQQREERIFMGDTSFARYVQGLCECRYPLLQDAEGEYSVKPTGRDVLAGRSDHVRLNGINRWLGGVHLAGAEALWRWDEVKQQLVRH